MKIELDTSPTDESISRIYDGLARFNEPHFPGLREETLGLYAKNDDDEIVGGLYALIHSSTVWLKYIWLAEQIRGQGTGSELVSRLEDEVRKRGVDAICVDTYSFQAPAFYEKHGFVEAGRFINYAKPGVDRIFFQKHLCPQNELEACDRSKD